MFLKPIVLAMIICDHYYRDNHSGKSLICGTFSAIEVESFPTEHHNCGLYVALTDIAKSGQVQIVLRKENGSYTVDLPKWRVKAPENRRAVVEVGGNIGAVPLPEPGSYEFAVFWNDSEIFSRHFYARKVDKL